MDKFYMEIEGEYPMDLKNIKNEINNSITDFMISIMREKEEMLNEISMEIIGCGLLDLRKRTDIDVVIGIHDRWTKSGTKAEPDMSLIIDGKVVGLVRTHAPELSDYKIENKPEIRISYSLEKVFDNLPEVKI